MPFCLCSTPCIITILTRAVTHHCRCRGIRVIFYLDDSIILACSRATAIVHQDFVMSLLSKLGFIINLQKSDLAPTCKYRFLGLNWDSTFPMVSLTDIRVSTLRSSTHCLLWKEAPFCREIQQFLGRTNFASFALPRARLNSRAIQRCLSQTYKSPSHLFRRCVLSSEAKKEHQWWVSFTPLGKPCSLPGPRSSLRTYLSSDFSCNRLWPN